MKNINVLVLAGGDSTRMWPIADKNSIQFCGKPVFFHFVKNLEKNGFSEITVIANKNNRDFLSGVLSSFVSMKTTILQQKFENGMAGAILTSEKLISGKPLLIAAPTDITDGTLMDNFKKEMTNDPEMLITVKRVNEYFPGGYVRMEKNCISEIIEKPKPGKAPGNLINLVWHYFRNPDGLLSILKESDGEYAYETALNKLFGRGVKAKSLEYSGIFNYLKYPWHILDAGGFFLKNLKNYRGSNILIKKSAVLEGEVYISDGVKIMDNAMILGPAYIGEGTVIGNNSFVRESMIGKNCIVGYSTEIARSHISDSCMFHNNYIGDSVVGDGVIMGAGAVCANYRFDGKNIKSIAGKILHDTNRQKFGAAIGKDVRIGVNASIMPGIKLGKNVTVMSGATVQRDVEDDCIYSMETNYSIKKKKA